MLSACRVRLSRANSTVQPGGGQSHRLTLRGPHWRGPDLCSPTSGRRSEMSGHLKRLRCVWCGVCSVDTGLKVEKRVPFLPFLVNSPGSHQGAERIFLAFPPPPHPPTLSLPPNSAWEGKHFLWSIWANVLDINCISYFPNP